MENEEYSSVIGNPSAPYQNSLASSYALAADYFGVAHPSLPNYLALISGSTFGVTSDCQPAQCSQPSNVTTIATLLDSHHLSWKEYAESMPTNCSQVVSSDDLYYPKHNPFVYFAAITGNNGTGSTSSYCDSHVVSLSQFYSDLQAGDLPNYSFVTPNICDDAHSCPLSTRRQLALDVRPQDHKLELLRHDGPLHHLRRGEHERHRRGRREGAVHTRLALREAGLRL